MKGKRRGVAARALAVGLLAGAIAGCSVPDWADPGEWFDDSAPPPPRRSSGRPIAPPPSEAAQPQQQAQSQQQSQQQAVAPSDEKDFPELASTPERPQPRTTPAQRRQIQQGLVADRENARYSERVPVGGDVQAPPPPPPPPPPSSSLAPAPRPQAARSVPDASPTAAPAAASWPPSPPPPPPAAVSSEPRAFGASDPAAPQVFSPERPVAAEPPRPAPPTVPPAPSALTAPPPPPPVAASVAPAPPPPPASRDGASRSPAAPPSAAPQPPAPPPTPVPQLNLPVAQDQQVLAEAFAQSVAAQAAPVSPAPGSNFSPGATFSPGPVSAPPPQSAALAPSGLVSAPSGAPLATITFAHGGAALGSNDLAEIRRVAQAARGGGVVRVVGHASQRTANMSMEEHRLANFNVSFERAQAVARALRRAGVDPGRLIVEAVGDSQPLYYEFMPNGEAENRRVEIFVE